MKDKSQVKPRVQQLEFRVLSSPYPQSYDIFTQIMYAFKICIYLLKQVQLKLQEINSADIAHLTHILQVELQVSSHFVKSSLKSSNS